MKSVTVTFIDGTNKEFRETGRTGGSYTIKVKCEGGCIIITDEYDNQTFYPLERIKEVTTEANRSWGY